jgi:hypothetical protein
VIMSLRGHLDRCSTRHRMPRVLFRIAQTRKAARNYSDPSIKWVEADSIRAANETRSRSVPARVATLGVRKNITETCGNEHCSKRYPARSLSPIRKWRDGFPIPRASRWFPLAGPYAS